jgi:hypothetical protein
MAVTLTLGGVVFQDFEIPESINFGGDHKLIIHQLPGGSRVIDAMGPDDSEIRWTGRFRGESAEQRALLLDFLRRQGGNLLLNWSLHRYQVVIREFKADFRQSYEIPYSISCTVVLDEIQALATAAIGFIEALAADLLTATGLAGVIGMPAINTAVTGVATAFSNYQAGVPNSTNLITTATASAEPALLGSLLSSISGAQSAVTGAINSTGAAINTTGSVGGVTAGGAPAAMASTLTSQSSAFSQLGTLYQLSSTLGRMYTNTNNVGK